MSCKMSFYDLFTNHNNLWVLFTLLQKAKFHFIFLSNISLYIYTLYLYLFICQWALFPSHIYCIYYAAILEKAMASHSSTLAWKIPWTEEPGRLQSMGSLRVGHDWGTSLWLFTFMHWRRKWQPTPVFLPGESQGRGSLVGCRLWGRTESDTTEATL